MFMSNPHQLAPSSSSNFLSSYNPLFIPNPSDHDTKFSSYQHEGGSISCNTSRKLKDENSGSSNSMRNGINSGQTSVFGMYADRTSPSTRVLHRNKNSYMVASDCTVRVCTDCNTTKTPLWRSGPQGPKSLCNACGIRQRKARKAAMAASSGIMMACHNKPAMKNKVIKHKEKQMSHRVEKYNSDRLPLKKRCMFKSRVRLMDKKRKNQLHFEDLMIILNKNSAFQRVFNQDEKEGAILLMALSYGLVLSS